ALKWPAGRPDSIMREYAGRAGSARDRGDARRDRHRGGLPAAAAGSPLSALWHRDGAAPKPVLGPPAARAATTLVSRVRVGRRGAAGACDRGSGLGAGDSEPPPSPESLVPSPQFCNEPRGALVKEIIPRP